MLADEQYMQIRAGNFKMRADELALNSLDVRREAARVFATFRSLEFLKSGVPLSQVTGRIGR